MTQPSDFKKISDFEWMIPKSYRADMKVPVRFFITEEILFKAIADRSTEQAINASTLPGVTGEVIVMPDVHQGYGFPIGGIAATRLRDGVISPGAIGYDINCGVRLLSSSVPADIGSTQITLLADLLNNYCPSGVGVKGAFTVSNSELDEISRTGSRWAMKKGMASQEDLLKTEEDGCFDFADPTSVSNEAKDRGKSQLGTLGSGNHFLEVDIVDEIHDKRAANIMGLQENCLVIQIHCGSRGFGHQICTDYVHSFQSVSKKFGFSLSDRELVCAPLDSREGQAYLAAMRSAANFAFCNRQILAHYCRKAFKEVFNGKVNNSELTQVYDLAHNMGKIETHLVNGQKEKVCVHRKGATRAFGPGSPMIPDVYAKVGQPVLVPGSMGSASWVLAGTAGNMLRTFGSCCHGAGRIMSRGEAKRRVRGERLREDLESSGITVRAGSFGGLAEEAPSAYKDVDSVVEVVSRAGIATKVARLKPVIVIKG